MSGSISGKYHRYAYTKRLANSNFKSYKMLQQQARLTMYMQM